MVNHTQTICRQTNCLSVFDHFLGLALKGLTKALFIFSVYSVGLRVLKVHQRILRKPLRIVFGSFLLLLEMFLSIERAKAYRRWCGILNDVNLLITILIFYMKYSLNLCYERVLYKLTLEFQYFNLPNNLCN